MIFIYKAALLTGIFYAFYMLLLQKETFFNTIRAYFIIGMLLAIGLALVTIPIVKEAPEIALNYNAQPSFDSSVIPTEETVNWNSILRNIYLMGLFVFIIKLGLEFRALYRIIKKASKTKDAGIIYAETYQTLSPFSIFNYIVFNREKFTATELEKILTHERLHVHQKHSYDLLLANIFTLVFWFNPLAWLYKRRLQENLEYIADKHTTKYYNKKTYQYLLLKETITQNPFTLNTNFYQSFIKKRIIMLEKKESKIVNQLKYLLLVPTLALFLFAFSTKTVYANVAKTVSIAQAKTVVQNSKDIFISFSKTTTDKKLETIKNQLKKAGITCTFSGVKRNKSGEITAITITLKDEVSVQKRAIAISNSEKTIAHIILGRKAGGLFIDSSETGECFVFSKEEKGSTVTNAASAMAKSKDNEALKKALYIVDGKMTDVKSIDYDKLVMEQMKVYKGEKAIALYGEKAKNGVIVITTKKKDENTTEIKVENNKKENNIEALYIVNGKTMDASTFNNLNIDTDDIVKINVIKGKTAIEKYGSEGENGVVIITTKDQKQPTIKTGYFNYNNSNYFYTITDNHVKYYNRYGEEQKNKKLVVALNKKLQQPKSDIITSTETQESNDGFLKYKDKNYYYAIKNNKIVFYDRYGAMLTDKKLIRKLKLKL